MAKPWAKQFYRSERWQACRNGYIQHRVNVDGGLCESCREQLGVIVHHRTALTPANIGDPAVALSWDNLAYECLDCHNLHDGHGLRAGIGDRARSVPVCRFDADGNPVSIRSEFEHDRL